MAGTEDRDRPPRDRRWVWLAVITVAVFVGCAWLRGRLLPDHVAAARPANCRRIVSLAPNATETLFALGLGNRVVGVSRYCNYPTEACDRPRVGGLYDPNMEAIVALRPDLVVMPAETTGSQEAFAKLGLATLVVDHRDPDGVCESISAIGGACGAKENAAELVAELRRRLQRVKEKTAGRAPARVLLAVDHGLAAGRIADVYVAGSSPYFNPILWAAGGENVFQNVPEAFPVVSREAILRANPEVIVDLVRVGMPCDGGEPAIRAAWQELEAVNAVKNHRVHLVANDYATVPGPRFILLVEQLARLLHPEVDWK